MAPTATPKGMSSRLMTMKFMQRGEASAKSSPATTPKTDNEGSAKRRKTAHKETPEAKPLYDEKAVQAALEEEERKRQAAIARRAKELGDEQWVLNGAAVSAPTNRPRGNLSFVQVGFAQIDSGFSDDDDKDGAPASQKATGLAGRRQFNMKKGTKRAAVSYPLCTSVFLGSCPVLTTQTRSPSRIATVAATVPIRILSLEAKASRPKKMTLPVAVGSPSPRAHRLPTARGIPTLCPRGVKPNGSRRKN
jgi:hypothetical protein